MHADDGFRRQLLRDSEATLRQVRGVLTGLAENDGPDARQLQAHIEESSENAAEIADLLVTTQAEIRSIVDVLHRGRMRMEVARTDVAPPLNEEADPRSPADIVLVDVELRVQRLYHRFALGLDLGKADATLADAGTGADAGAG